MSAKGPVQSASQKPGLLTFAGDVVGSIGSPLSPLLIDPSVFQMRNDAGDVERVNFITDLFGVFFGKGEGPKEDEKTPAEQAEETSTFSAFFVIAGLIVLGVIAANLKRFKT